MVVCDREFSLVNTDVSKGSLVRGLLAVVKFVNRMKLIPADAGFELDRSSASTRPLDSEV